MPERNASWKQPCDLIVDCVVLTAFVTQFLFLKNVMRLTGIRMHHADTLDQADFLLTVTGSRVVLADAVFPDGACYDALAMLEDRHPLVTVLVVADPVDRGFLRDVRTRGACGIIWRPIEFDGTRRLIRTVHEASKERETLLNEQQGAICKYQSS
jgi:DNA-binding NtrC family response regulator